MVAPFSKFYGKICVVFCLNTGKRFFLEAFFLNPTERTQVLLENGTTYFQNNLPFARAACFYVKISGNFERFQYFNFEADFLENKNIFQKTEVPCSS